MTKIKTYSVKNPVIDSDKWIGSNGESGETKNFTAQDVADYVKTQLTPIDGGVFAVTEIDIETLTTDISTTVNTMSPSYDVAPYELVHFVIEGRVYILKVVNATIGVGGIELSNTDFIILPVNTGPQGDAGATGNGIDSIVLYDTIGLVKTYRITFTDTTTFDFDVTDGTNGLKADMTRTSEDELTITNSGLVTVNFSESLNLGIIEGMRVRLTNSPGLYMEGMVFGVTSTSLAIQMDYSVGSGTYTSWLIGVAGDPGANQSNPIIHELASGTPSLTITSQSIANLDYEIYFQKDHGKVFMSGYIINNTSGDLGANEVFTFTDSSYAGLSTYLYGNKGTTASTNFALQITGTSFNLLDNLLDGERVNFSMFYYID